jgi:hypothetical protein
MSASSSIISSFRFNEDGSVEIDSLAANGEPVNPDAANPAAGATGFVDVAETGKSSFLYDLESGTGKVDVYQITSPDAPLTVLQQMSTGLPQSAELWASLMSNRLLRARFSSSIVKSSRTYKEPLDDGLTVGGPSSYSVSGSSHNRAVSCILGLAGKATVLAVELSRDFAEWRVQS